MIVQAVEANRIVSESVALPWHAVDVLVGRDACALRSLEVDYG